MLNTFDSHRVSRGAEDDVLRCSVVIATYNRAPLLAETLEALGRQRYRHRFEIVVADNGSADDTRAVVERIQRRSAQPIIRYLNVETPGKSHALNAAMDMASGQTIALTDDDVVPEPEWLESLARAFAETGADFVAGRILPRWESPPPPWMSPALYGVLAVPDGGDHRLSIDAASSAIMPIGANMAVRRAAIDAIGRWRTDLGKLRGTLRTGEDHEFFLRLLAAGRRGVYEPAARVHHLVPRERLRRGYFRRWFAQNGADVAAIDRAGPAPLPRVLRIPRYLWREAARDALALAGAALRGDPAGTFARFTRLVWLGGYVRAAWSARPPVERAAGDSPRPDALAAHR
jgi:glucosyl-dolichyl phosphate glucuronosyltransferase